MHWSNAHPYLICWMGSFWRGLAAGSGLLCSRTVAFPAWLWKNTTLEKKIDFSKISPSYCGLQSGIAVVRRGQAHEFADQRHDYLNALQWKLRAWSCSAEWFITGITGVNLSKSNESHNIICCPNRSFSYFFVYLFVLFSGIDLGIKRNLKKQKNYCENNDNYID